MAKRKARTWEGKVCPQDDEAFGYRVWLNSLDQTHEFPKWMRRKRVRITEVLPKPKKGKKPCRRSK